MGSGDSQRIKIFGLYPCLCNSFNSVSVVPRLVPPLRIINGVVSSCFKVRVFPRGREHPFAANAIYFIRIHGSAVKSRDCVGTEVKTISTAPAINIFSKALVPLERRMTST
jgi:hypothetical protein